MQFCCMEFLKTYKRSEFETLCVKSMWCEVSKGSLSHTSPILMWCEVSKGPILVSRQSARRWQVINPTVGRYYFPLVLGGTTVLPRYHFFTVPVPWSSLYFLVPQYHKYRGSVVRYLLANNQVNTPFSQPWTQHRTHHYGHSYGPITHPLPNAHWP